MEAWVLGPGMYIQLKRGSLLILLILLRLHEYVQWASGCSQSRLNCSHKVDFPWCLTQKNLRTASYGILRISAEIGGWGENPSLFLPSCSHHVYPLQLLNPPIFFLGIVCDAVRQFPQGLKTEQVGRTWKTCKFQSKWYRATGLTVALKSTFISA